MNLLEMLLDNQGLPALQRLASGFGLDEGNVRKVLTEMVPALSRGMHNNLSKQGGLEDLLGALGKGNHQRYIEQPESLSGEEATREGNAILGHLLGSKDVSRRVASHASGKTGVDASLLKKMLPVIATMVMGAVSKQAGAQNIQGGLASAGTGSGSAGLLNRFLDADKDGSVLDDILGMAGKFL
ncbi:MAG: DUF937 domain-containing protein [Gammaproteobacteria bacterium]|nr:DUF937 domain-containing protein [Gammaproteobacteria bacterium]